MRAGTSRQYGSKPMSGRQAASALSMLLSGCRDEQLRGFTAEHLAATHKVPLKTCEQMLATARERRS